MKGCRPFTNEEVNLLSQSFGGKFALRDQTLFTLGVLSGFRVAELLSIQIKDVYQHDQIVDRVTVKRKSMKGQVQSRTVILHNDAKIILGEWIHEMAKTIDIHPDYFVFKSRKGANKPISRVQALRILRDAFDSCEIVGQLGTHSMRKTFANNVHEKLGRDLHKTQQALGQRNITTTIQYLSFRQEDIDEAILSL